MAAGVRLGRAVAALPVLWLLTQLLCTPLVRATGSARKFCFSPWRGRGLGIGRDSSVSLDSHQRQQQQHSVQDYQSCEFLVPDFQDSLTPRGIEENEPQNRAEGLFTGEAVSVLLETKAAVNKQQQQHDFVFTDAFSETETKDRSNVRIDSSSGGHDSSSQEGDEVSLVFENNLANSKNRLDDLDLTGSGGAADADAAETATTGTGFGSAAAAAGKQPNEGILETNSSGKKKHHRKGAHNLHTNQDFRFTVANRSESGGQRKSRKEKSKLGLGASSSFSGSGVAKDPAGDVSSSSSRGKPSAGVTPIRRKNTQASQQPAKEQQQDRPMSVQKASECQSILRQICPEAKTPEAILQCVAKNRAALENSGCPTRPPKRIQSNSQHHDGTARIEIKKDPGVGGDSTGNHFHRTKASTGRKKAASWWLDPLPWWMPPPPEWGPLPPTMYTSFFHQPKAAPMTTPNYGPLYNPGGFNPVSPYRITSDVSTIP